MTSRRTTFDYIDDPSFDLTTAQLIDDHFSIRGTVELQGGRLLYEAGSSRTLQVHPVTLRIDRARTFSIDDVAGTGVLILEGVRYANGTIHLTGVVPCVIAVTADTSEVYFEIDEPVNPAL